MSIRVRLRVSAPLLLGGVLLVATAMGAGCGSSDGSSAFSGDDGGDVDGAFGDGGGAIFDGSFNTGDAAAQGLTVSPQGAVLDVTLGGAAVTQQYTATKPSSSTPVVANWSMDTPGLGSIDATGLFKASGKSGGTATITAQSGSATGTAQVTVKLHISENPGNVDPGTQGGLKGGADGGAVDPAFKMVYPYDATVFPRGLLPPLLQFGGSSATAFYVHMTANAVDYQGFFGGGTSISIAPATWNAIVGSVGANDPLRVQVTKIVNGVVSGPITQSWIIAQGSLKGTLYYNSYNSALGGGQGAVLRIKPAAATPEVLISGCTVCHAISANGSTLVANHADYTTGASYDLSAGTVNPPVLQEQTDSSMGFGAVFPDGSFLLSNASIGGQTWHSNPSGGPNVVGFGDLSGGERASHLYDTKSGAIIAASGFDGVVTHALMPQFAPDGKKVAFNNYDQGNGHSLQVMDFAASSKSFSGLTTVMTDTTAFPGWPFFTPDSKAVIFHTTDNGDYATLNYSTNTANKGLLKIVDIASKSVAPLDLANGYRNGQLYLPFGADDQDKNYEPTVLPVAAGGYYWVVFTSRRDYGNLLTHGNPMAGDRKKLWVAAIDINATPGKDASHPAFYLPGQEASAGNMRGFWALDPCKQKGNDCSSGDECCTGFCRQVNGDAGAAFQCVPPQSGCANEYEHCTTAADCCGVSEGFTCINGFCARPPPK